MRGECGNNTRNSASGFPRILFNILVLVIFLFIKSEISMNRTLFFEFTRSMNNGVYEAKNCVDGNSGNLL